MTDGAPNTAPRGLFEGTRYEPLAKRAGSSRKAAIRSFCLECMGMDSKGVTECTDTQCRLFSWRVEG
jgi:hypothetical protein